MMHFIPLMFGLVIVALLPVASIAGIALKESTCMSTVVFPFSNNFLDAEMAYLIENDLTRYFDDLVLRPNDNATNTAALDNNTPALSELLADVDSAIEFRVDVADAMVMNEQATVTVAVTLLYEAREKAHPVPIATILTEAIAHQSHAMALSRNFGFTTDAAQVMFTFRVMENDTIAIQLRSGNGYSRTEVGLIVVTSFLSFVLVIVSSVLLYITGGWTICRAKVTNCLFEEVDDDEEINILAHKGTYPMQSSDEDDDGIVHHHEADDEEDDDEHSQSHMTSIPPSSASGILGVAHNREHPAFLSPNGGRSDDESSMMYGDSTPLSRSNQMPLGITSMRKMPQPDFAGDQQPAPGGFSGMMMQRLTRSASKRN